MSVDGTHDPINETSSFSPRWFSYKLNGPRLRYEVAISINGGRIVWGNGPFKQGEMKDLQIFRKDLKHELDEKEMVCTNDGYPDKKCLR